MSITLNIKTLAKKILNCTEQQFIDRRERGNYKKSATMTKISNDVMNNLEIFGDSAQVVKENVDKFGMFKAIKRLLKNSNYETVVYEFPAARSSKLGMLIRDYCEFCEIKLFVRYQS